MLFCALAAVLLASAARAQTRYEWPKDSIDVTTYATVEDCLAATGRVRDSIDAESAGWDDTLPADPAQAQAPLPSPVTQIAWRCGARFMGPTASLENFAPLLQLALLAARDSSAAVLVRRRLAAGGNAANIRAAILDTAIQAYLGQPFEGSRALGVQPVRLAPAEALTIELGQVRPAAPWAVRLRDAAMLEEAALQAGDSTRARRAATGVLAVANQITTAERRGTQYKGAVPLVYAAANLLSGTPLLDSLRHGTAGYVALERANWAKANGESSGAPRFPIGQAVPPITADLWFRRGDSTGARPTKGSVALVIFLDQRPCFFSPNSCRESYAVLRRMAQRYPALQITLVAQTRGYLLDAAPPTPEEEADSLAKAWLDERHLPGALAIVTTRFWQLPAPDRRRIDRDVPNATQYTFAQDSVTSGMFQIFQLQQIPPTAAVHGFRAFLVDRSGTIVDANLLIRDQEQHLAQLVNVLLAQPVAARP